MIVDFGQVLPWLVKPEYSTTRSRFSLSTLIIGKIWGLFHFHHVTKQWHKVFTSDWQCMGESNLHILLMSYHRNNLKTLETLENHAEISFGNWPGYPLSFTFILIHIAYHSPSVKVSMHRIVWSHYAQFIISTSSSPPRGQFIGIKHFCRLAGVIQWPSMVTDTHDCYQNWNNSGLRNEELHNSQIVCPWVLGPAEFKSGLIFEQSILLHCHSWLFFVINFEIFSKLWIKLSA